MFVIIFLVGGGYFVAHPSLEFVLITECLTLVLYLLRTIDHCTKLHLSSAALHAAIAIDTMPINTHLFVDRSP